MKHFMKTMQIRLKPWQLEHINKELQEGRYMSRNELVRELIDIGLKKKGYV